MGRENNGPFNGSSTSNLVSLKRYVRGIFQLPGSEIPADRNPMAAVVRKYRSTRVEEALLRKLGSSKRDQALVRKVESAEGDPAPIRKHEASSRELHLRVQPSQDQPLDPTSASRWKRTAPQDIRLLMRRVPHPVAVITANLPAHKPPESFCAMTVSSFNTVCLEPKVVVSFNVKLPSATYDAIQASGHFDIHLINSTVEGAAIAELCSTGRGRDLFKADDGESPPPTPSTAEAQEEEEGQPAPLRSTDVMFALQCRLLEPAVKVADHVVVLGEVLAHRLPATVKIWDGVSLGMCYVNRLYRRPGRVQLLPAHMAHLGRAAAAAEDTADSTSLSESPEEESSQEEDTVPVFY